MNHRLLESSRGLLLVVMAVLFLLSASQLLTTVKANKAGCAILNCSSASDCRSDCNTCNGGAGICLDNP